MEKEIVDGECMGLYGIVREIVERCGKDKKMGIKVDIKRKLGEFSLDIHFQTESKRIGILGASGCGKSMTLKSIAGIETPDFGMIQIDDKVLFDSANKVDLKPQKRNVGYLFQNYALFPTMTVAKNIAAGLKRQQGREAKKKYRK